MATEFFTMYNQKVMLYLDFKDKWADNISNKKRLGIFFYRKCDWTTKVGWL